MCNKMNAGISSQFNYQTTAWVVLECASVDIGTKLMKISHFQLHLCVAENRKCIVQTAKW